MDWEYFLCWSTQERCWVEGATRRRTSQIESDALLYVVVFLSMHIAFLKFSLWLVEIFPFVLLCRRVSYASLELKM
jgi:hypothetical protein